MADAKKTFDAKDPAEFIPLSFDFEWLASAPLAPVITISRFSGTADNSDLSAMMVGAPQVIGTRVLQKVIGGVAGTNYLLRCKIDTPDGMRWILAGILPVKTA